MLTFFLYALEKILKQKFTDIIEHSQTWLRWWKICLKWRRPGSLSRLGRFPGEENSNPLQYSCLENPMDRGDSWATVHRVSKSWTQLSDMCVIITAQMLTINEYPIGLQSTLIYNWCKFLEGLNYLSMYFCSFQPGKVPEHSKCSIKVCCVNKWKTFTHVISIDTHRQNPKPGEVVTTNLPTSFT